MEFNVMQAGTLKLEFFGGDLKLVGPGLVTGGGQQLSVVDVSKAIDWNGGTVSISVEGTEIVKFLPAVFKHHQTHFMGGIVDALEEVYKEYVKTGKSPLDNYLRA